MFVFCVLAKVLFAQEDASAMLKQIAALQVYIADAENGYKIVEEGVNTIGQIKNGEFTLHSLFFSSLKAVSPTVRNMAEIGEIVALQASIVEQFSRSLKTYRQSGSLSNNEVTTIGKVYSSIVSAGLADVTALMTLLTDDALGMTDGERIKRIQGLDADMREQWAFTKEYTGQADLLSLQRSREQGDWNTVGQLYGIQ